jgi:hypothetical protein
LKAVLWLVAGAASIAGFALAGAIAWALWPLSDPRFDWKPHYKALLAKGDCAAAISLVYPALSIFDRDAASAAIELSKNPACTAADWGRVDPAQFARTGAAFLKALDTAGARLPARARWEPGWLGPWFDRNYVWIYVRSEFAYYLRKHSGFAAIGAPVHVMRYLRCDYTLFGSPGGKYFRMRTDLARDHGYGELRLDDWEWRMLFCFRHPSVGGASLYRPRQAPGEIPGLPQ